MAKNILLKLAILLFPASLLAQLNVAPNSNATQLAQAITGSGVTVTNASLTCGSGGSGTFSYAGSTLTLTSGILLTTGLATDASMPAQIVSQSTGNNFSDPNLTSIESAAIYDNCILSFDFVPICNQVSIKYTFGSSEYDGYQCSSYNDAFGIFLTGANPSGGTYNATNIATLPNGTAVSINNVNDGSDQCTSPHNQSYYVNNFSGTDIVYEGLTTAITSTKPVVPCSTYHMKIAIADAGDEVYDSGVFIGGNAVSCQTAPSAAITSTGVSCGGSNGTASVTVSNYSATPTYSWSPGGQTTPSLTGLSAGTYTCLVTFQTGCSGVFTQTLTTTVSNPPNSLSVTASASPATCSGSSTGSATVSISGGTAPYTVGWNTSPVQTTTVVNSLTPGTYSVAVHDNAGCFQTVSVTVGITNPTVLTFTNVQTCGSNLVLNASAGSTYQWYDTSNVIISGAIAQTYNASNVSNGQHYIVSFKDNTTGCKDSLQFNISKYNLNFSFLPSPPCNGGNNGSISLTPSGTYTFSSYDWNLSGTVSNSGTSTVTPISVPNLGAGTYSVSVNPTGNPSCSYSYTIQLVQGAMPAPILDTVKVCNQDTIKLNPPVAAGSTNNWYLASPFGPLGTSLANVAYPIYPIQHTGTSYIDTVKSAAGCVSVYKVSVKIQSFQKNISIVQQLKCYNDSTGKVKISIPREYNGPINHPYTFTWVYPSPYTAPGVVTTNATAPLVPINVTESNLHPGYYYCVIKTGNCVDTAKITLQNPAKLHTDSIYAYYCPKDSLALVIADTGQANYVWHPNNSVATSTGDSAHVPLANLNSFYVTYLRNGCPDTGKIIVSVTTYDAFRPDELVNVFSPNGDKINDYFYPFYSQQVNQYQIFKQSDTYELYIYDRWGKQVYSTTDYSKPWDGKTKSGHSADAGSYFFVVKYKSNCGSKADLVEKKGFLELVR